MRTGNKIKQFGKSKEKPEASLEVLNFVTNNKQVSKIHGPVKNKVCRGTQVCLNM